MDYKDVLLKAKETIGPNCKVCPECNGLGCGNMMPGPGSKAPGNGANDNWKAWRSIKLNMDVIAPSTPVDTSLELFGKHFDVPIFSAPVGSIRWQYNPTDDVRDYNDKVIAACAATGAAASFGDGIEPSVLPRALEAGAAHGGIAMAVLNPNSDDEIKARLDQVNAAKPFAACVVIDSAGLPHLRQKNLSAGTKTIEQLRELREYCKVPFVVKGIMTAKSALKALEAGVDGIIVSNHGGRVLASTPATAEVLPEIVDAVAGRAKIIVDGGIRSGVDIFKALALGADAVMVCRPFIISYYGGGSEGVQALIEKYKAELDDTMYMCGARKLSDISRDMIRF